MSFAEFEPTGWWRVIDPEGKMWCETSNEKEARDRTRPGDTLQQLYERVETEWKDVVEVKTERKED